MTIVLLLYNLNAISAGYMKIHSVLAANRNDIWYVVLNFLFVFLILVK